ncbi:MAG: LysR family transcriptional regulator [Deltaproteobacteria bacterium]|nr:LysR family transcriptional regulator [Deltaproteobacteria bacterium]
MRDVIGSIDLNLLYTFFLVVESGGVGRAARLLGRTQPAVTARLRQLEDELGAALLEKQGRGVAPTALGREVLDDVRAMVGHARAVVDAARESHVAPSGTLRVAALPMVGVHVAAPALVALAREYDKIDVDIRPGLVDDLLEWLRQGVVDVALTVGDVHSEVVVSEALGRVGAVAIGTRALADAAGSGPVTPAALGGLGLVSYPRAIGDPFYQAVEAFFGEHDLVARVRHRVPHIQTMKALVRAGAGAAIVPDYTAGDPDLVARPVLGLTIEAPLVALVRPGARRRALVRRLLELVANAARK